MRSKATNVLQGVILVTGIIYIIIGLFFSISPYKAFKIFAFGSEAKIGVSSYGPEGGSPDKSMENPESAEDDWLTQIVNDEIISPLYYIFRVFAFLLAVCGVAMVMPLFDPLRYRGLVYYNGLIFPFVSALSIMLFINSQKSINIKIAADLKKEAITWQVGHYIMPVLAAIFTIIFILTAIGLIITRKQAKEGKE